MKSTPPSSLRARLTELLSSRRTEKSRADGPVPLSLAQIKDVSGGLPKTGGWGENAVILGGPAT